MANKKDRIQADRNLEKVEGALSKTEQFIENNQKQIIYVVLAIVVVIAGIIGYNRFVTVPKTIEANSQIYAAEFYFEVDSFYLALEGDGANLGFLDVIDDYSNTPVGKLAYYYSGVCYMRLGEYETAIEYLSNYSGDDKILQPNAIGLIGDAHAELGDMSNAISNYKKAAEMASNNFLSPMYLMRAGIALEKEGKYQDALDVYNKIEKDYYGTKEQQNIEKYITRAKLHLN